MDDSVLPVMVAIRRAPLLATHELRDAYRFKDLFQLVPPGSEDPRPPFPVGTYGLTLELRFDSRVAPAREEDVWAHDYRERERVEYLRNHPSISGVPDRDEWLSADNSVRGMSRHRAIVRELCRLLSLLTNYSFREPGNSYVWVLCEEQAGSKARWAREWHPSFAKGTSASFTEPRGSPVPRVPSIDYYQRLRGYGPGEAVIELPDALDTQLSAYFDLSHRDMLAFARALELLGTATDVWRTSRSVSLAASVFAVEALVHATDSEPSTCGECGNLLSPQRCPKCNGPKHHLTRRFRDFVGQYVKDAELDAAELWRARSGIAHRGVLLRSDEFDSGFNTGGRDNEAELDSGVLPLVRRVLRGWLAEQRVGLIHEGV